MSQHFEGQGDFIGILSVPSVVTNCGQVDVSDLRDGHKNIKKSRAPVRSPGPTG